MALNYLPKPLSPSRFTQLLSAFSVPLPNSTLNRGFLPLLDNFTAHYTHYSQSPSLCTQFLSALAVFQSFPAIWPTLQARFPPHFPQIPPPSSPSSAVVEVKTSLWSWEIAPATDFSQQGFTVKEQLFLCFVDDVCRDRHPDHFLAEMQEVFIRDMKDLSLEAVLMALKLLAKEGLYLSIDLVKAVEDKILAGEKPLKNWQFEAILKAFQVKAFYGRVSSAFWPKFSAKCTQNTTKYPGSLLSRASASYFFESSFYHAIVPRLQAIPPLSNPRDFTEGVRGILMSSLATKDWLHWCHSEMLQALPSLSTVEVRSILNAMMLANLYAEDVWTAAISELAVRSIPNEELSKLFFLIKGLELDNPAFAAALLSKHKELYAICKANASTRRRHSIISSQEATHMRLIARSGLEMRNGVKLLDLYTVDCYLPGVHTVVEILGRPYHVSQVDGSLDILTQAKARHFLHQGYSVVLVTTQLTPEILSKLSARLQTLSQPQLLSVGTAQVCSRVTGRPVEQIA